MFSRTDSLLLRPCHFKAPDSRAVDWLSRDCQIGASVAPKINHSGQLIYQDIYFSATQTTLSRCEVSDKRATFFGGVSKKGLLFSNYITALELCTSVHPTP